MELDQALNCIPSSVKTIHLMAVCGTAMGALACMLKDIGFEVTGSDANVYPPMSDFLAEKGVSVINGFQAENLAHGPDLVVVGNAVTRHNPEAQEMIRLGLNYCSMPQAIQWVAAKDKLIILVTGTHGKTTTSSLIAWMLFNAGFDPSFLIGGILKNFNSNYRLGTGRFMVLEGDEYDTAFFDKGPKFLHYLPFRTVLTSIEFDHADIYRDMDHVKSAFQKLMDRIPESALLLAADHDPNIRELACNTTFRHLFYGKEASSDWTFRNVHRSGFQSRFDAVKSQQFFGTFHTNLLGDYNLYNILAAVGISESIGLSSDTISDALKSFQGVRRRQEIRGIVKGITVMDDFAHHPTAVRETIHGVKPAVGNGRLIAVFEPRSNTSMRNIFQDEYPKAFDGADIICIRTPSRLDKIPVTERLSAEKMVDDLKQQGKQAVHFPDTDSILHFLKQHARSGDVILIMSNGGFDRIHSRLLADLS